MFTYYTKYYLIDNMSFLACSVFFFFNDTATTEIYTLSLHDALPICSAVDALVTWQWFAENAEARNRRTDRKSTRLNSSHSQISYAVFCLKKKKTGQRYLSPTVCISPSTCTGPTRHFMLSPTFAPS